MCVDAGRTEEQKRCCCPSHPAYCCRRRVMYKGKRWQAILYGLRAFCAMSCGFQLQPLRTCNALVAVVDYRHVTHARTHARTPCPGNSTTCSNHKTPHRADENRCALKQRKNVCHHRPSVSIRSGGIDDDFCATSVKIGGISQRHAARGRAEDRIPVHWRQYSVMVIS